MRKIGNILIDKTFWCLKDTFGNGFIPDNLIGVSCSCRPLHPCLIFSKRLKEIWECYNLAMLQSFNASLIYDLRKVCPQKLLSLHICMRMCLCVCVFAKHMKRFGKFLLWTVSTLKHRYRENYYLFPKRNINMRQNLIHMERMKAWFYHYSVDIEIWI